MKDMRGITAKAGDVVVCGEKQGSGPATLSIREVLAIKAGKLTMRGRSKSFVYSGSGGFLIVPRDEYIGLVGKSIWD